MSSDLILPPQLQEERDAEQYMTATVGGVEFRFLAAPDSVHEIDPLAAYAWIVSTDRAVNALLRQVTEQEARIAELERVLAHLKTLGLEVPDP